MSRLTRLGAVLLTGIVVLAVATPTVLAHDPVEISVSEDESSYTLEVTHNGSVVNDSTVNVTPTDPNATYAGADGVTDENGAVTFDLPANETAVNITVTFENHTESDTFELSGAADSDEEESTTDEPFGQRLTAWLHNLLGSSDGTIDGQTVSDWVTANNPGSEHRADNANPGGNDNGTPENASDESSNGNGPPDHANSGKDEVNDDGELEIEIDGEATANETVNVTVTHNGSGIENATVSVDDEAVGTTDAEGTLAVTLPDKSGETITISAEYDDLEGEIELKLAG
jgi:hypothetical protein